MKSIIRKPKSKMECVRDFYQTNPLMVKVLADWLKKRDIYNISSEKKHKLFSLSRFKILKVLDPCCGYGVIQNGLIDVFGKFNPIRGFDKYFGDVKADFLTHNKKYDLIVMNPPYSSKYKFMLHAMEISKVVIVLLPLNISNYNMFHREYEDIPEFVGKIKMAPKMFLDESTDFHAGGNSQYCWYIWDKDNKTDFSKTWYADLRNYQNNDKSLLTK